MNRFNKDGFRKCSCCKREKELTSVNFYKDKNRLSGMSYRCKECDRKKKDERKGRYKKLSPELKEKYKAKNRLYTSFGSGRATAMICAYRKADRKKGQTCDLDRQFILTEVFKNECFYCGDKNNIGCDRIDNNLGHIKSNVVPCCRDCNTSRMDNFTHDEMKIIGMAIRIVKDRRKNEDFNYQKYK